MFKPNYIITLLCLSSAIFFVTTASAELIELKSGKKIKAPIVTRADDLVTVDMGLGIVVTYYLEDIEKILADSKSSAEFEEYQLFLHQQLEHIQRIQALHQKNTVIQTTPAPLIENTYSNEVDKQIKDIETTVGNLNVDFTGEVNTFRQSIGIFISNQISNTGRFVKALGKLATSKFIIEDVLPSKITLLIVTSWLVACYPMMLLAKRRKEKYYWMTWVPVLHIYLLTRLTQKSVWRIVYLFVPLGIIFVPFVVPVEFYKWWFFGGILIGIINFFIVPALLWSELAEDMNQPSWWGFLTIIPVVNIVMMHKFNESFTDASQKRDQMVRRIAPHLRSVN